MKHNAKSKRTKKTNLWIESGGEGSAHTLGAAWGAHSQHRAGAGKSSQALYQPCTDVGVTAPDESAMARTEIPKPQLTQRVARMGWGHIGWLMVGREKGGDGS